MHKGGFQKNKMGRKATEKQKIRMREYYQENKEKLKRCSKEKYEKDRHQRLLELREYYLKNKEKILKRTSLWRKKRWANGKLKVANKKVLQAQGTAKYFIKLKPNCEICESAKNLQRHHWRYDKPLMVNTFCGTCHDIQHVKNFHQSRFGGGDLRSQN